MISCRPGTLNMTYSRAWQINGINRINNTNRINNGLINRCKLGPGLIRINSRLIPINSGLIGINNGLIAD